MSGGRPARRLRAIAVLTALAMAAAGATLWRRAADVAPSFETVRAAPDFEARLSEAATLAIATKDDAFTLTRGPEGRWGMAEEGGYRAKQDRLERIMTGLAGLELVERRTADPAWHGALDLTAPETGGEAVRVTVADAAGANLADILIGKTATPGVSASGALYARRAGEDQTWLARGDLAANFDRRNWLDLELPHIAPEAVARARVAPPQGLAWEIARDEEGGELTLVGAPEGAEIVKPKAISRAGEAASFLAFDDVAKGPLGAADTQVRVEDFSGLVIALRLAARDDGVWAEITSEAGPDADDETKATAARFAGLTEGWIYALPDYKTAELFTPLSEILVVPEAQDEPAAQGPETPPAPLTPE